MWCDDDELIATASALVLHFTHTDLCRRQTLPLLNENTAWCVLMDTKRTTECLSVTNCQLPPVFGKRL